MNKLSNNGHKRIAFINVHRSFNYGAQRKIAYESSIKNLQLQFSNEYYQDSLIETVESGSALTKLFIKFKKTSYSYNLFSSSFFYRVFVEMSGFKIKYWPRYFCSRI